ncbi:hypothetical protein [Paraburkholderia hospita]|uniref:hypothetical protein n=1 Tax=Paraburkholderia hospita TaxID=169430 RepID=UPI0008A76333|nr:hypothetical protein [Paraburkholderia hospita]SEI14935.1 hypothetical protein SAMN05192544_1025143 [Paraburkholderia hospita]
MRVFAIILGSVGFVVGLLAARYWFLASKVDPLPVWGDREPVDQSLAQAGWIVGLLEASSESARLNRRAAALTAVAVVLTTGSGVAGLF